jgi:catechol 2,3-dioxygenase-like lactoylglutathione lyase family enzyme
MQKINELHRGRLIDHLQLVVADLERSQRFYTAVMATLGIPIGGTGPGFFWVDELCISARESPSATGALTGRTHFAFQAPTREAVNAFYEAGLAAGGTDNGKPGERPYHPGYFASFLLDPDGNNVEAVYHGAAERSAPSVVLKF